MSISLTEKAGKELSKIISEQGSTLNSVILKVGIKGGGCSGFEYVLDLVEESREINEKFEQFGIKIEVDPKSYLYLKDLIIDFKDEIYNRGFVFNNPNQTSSCGCGKSFSA